MRKPKEKIFKAGTKIVFHSNCNYVGCDGQEEVILDEDRTESDLQSEASDRALETIQPEGWFTVGDGEED